MWRRTRATKHLDDDIRDHLARETEENVARGMAPDEARRQALLTFGNVALAKEDTSTIWTWLWFQQLKQDLVHSFRALRRAPGFVFVVVFTLALGIGANAVIFSAVDAVVFSEVPVADPDSLVEVYTSSGNPYGDTSYPDYFDLRDGGAFRGLAAVKNVSMTLEARGQAEALAAQLVSGNYFEVLGVTIPRGRAFAPDEDRIGAPLRVAVITHGLWHRVFNSDTALLGQTIRLNDRLYTLIGITPPGFAGPTLGAPIDVWVPSALQPEVDPTSLAQQRARGHAGKFDLRGSRGLWMLGRLPAGARVADVMARVDVVSDRLQGLYPDTNRNRRFTIAGLGEARGLRVTTGPLLRQLATVVLLVLLVACVNIASLLFVRAVSREKEVAVRIAIGASRARLVRQWFTESALLGLLGALAAVVVTRLSIPLIHAFVLPDSVDLTINPRLLTFTLLVGLGSSLLFGVAPLVQVLRRDTTNKTLREEGGTTTTSTRAIRLRSGFVVLQVATSMVLLVGAGLFLRTLANAYSVDLGYPIERTLVATINLAARGYSPETGLAAYEQILARVGAVPGVQAAGAARVTVLSGGARSTVVSLDGLPFEKDQRNVLSVRANVISTGYFSAMNIPILQGRDFSAADGPATPAVTVVTQSLADRLWPNESPTGKTLRDESNQVRQVVGVVPDTVYTSPLERERKPTYYTLLAQNYENAVTLHIRATANPLALVPAIRDALRQVDSQLPVERWERLRDVLDRSLNPQRMMATLVGLFGAVALLLTVCGLYGVMAHAASQRTREIGLRLALGATRASVVGLLVRQGLVLFATGAALGLAGALAATRYIEAQLFGVTATDPLTFVGAALLLGAVTVAACYFPARRATNIGLVGALRQA